MFLIDRPFSNMKQVIACASFFLGISCGSRSDLYEGEGLSRQSVKDCESYRDCNQSNLCVLQECVNFRCIEVEETLCNSLDACEVSRCEPETGQCVTERITQDLDGDGFFAPRPGFAPEQMGSCGRDCDDTSSAAYPGGEELCDGADNDCDGIIDNDSKYLSRVGDEPVSLDVGTFELDAVGGRGISFGDGTYALSYWGRQDLNLSYLRGVSVDGSEVFAQDTIASVKAPSFGGTLTWSGSSFGVAWSDPRVDDNYEVYFARFNSMGEKLAPDLRITVAEDFSIHPIVHYDQGRFALVWDDRRDEESMGGAKIFAQLISDQGELLGENTQLSVGDEIAEYPNFAATPERFGLVYGRLSGEGVGLSFRSFDKNWGDGSKATLVVARDVSSPNVLALGGNFVVSWSEYSDGPGDTIMGAVLNAQGQVLIGPQALTRGARFARSHTTISLGNRLVLVWVDNLHGNYELYAKVLDGSFAELEPRVRLTYSEADTLGPMATLGATGDIGVLYDDWRSGGHRAYFTTLGCGPGLLASSNK